MPAPAATAAILIIGNEILSGRTQDVNVQFIAARLAARGIKLSEVRVVRDEEAAIVKAVRELANENTYVFSTGGIGPTHDDITADCMAKAFNVPLEINAEARQLMQNYCDQRGVDLNEGRLRMARIPKGAGLIKNEASVAPGFKIKNVFVMAGVPKIMQSMFLMIEDTLAKGPAMLSKTVICNLREGDIALELEDIQNRYPDVEIGSYPGQNLSFVLRGTDDALLAKAANDVLLMAQKKDPAAIIAPLNPPSPAAPQLKK